MTDPAHPSGTDRCAEAARNFPAATHFINVQGDEPLVDPGLVSRLANALVEDPSVQMITAACPFPEGIDPSDVNRVKVVRAFNGDALYFSRSRIPYPRGGATDEPLLHMGIYGFTAAALHRFVAWPQGALEQVEQLEQLRALEHGMPIRVLLTDEISIGVDVPDDVARAEAWIAEASSSAMA
jgi:3-deoxy-manno-octulosonate cytidylyltransferase (CMP-KDO synthetase)